MADAEGVPPPPGPPPFLDARQVQRLCEQGHLALDLPTHLAEAYQAVSDDLKEFFTLSAEEKALLYPSRSADTEQGYVRVDGEKEFITLRYLPQRSVADDGSDPISEDHRAEKGWPKTETMEKRLSQTWSDTAVLLLRILADIAAALEIHPRAWDTLTEGSLALPDRREVASPSLLRLFRYEPQGGTAEAHTDLGLLTLCVCRGPGLQVFERQAQGTGQGDVPPGWRDAADATLLVGDTLRVLSSNRMRAGRHRVQATAGGRHSAVFGLRASTRGEIDLSLFGGHGAVDARQFWDALRGSRVNVNWDKDRRDAFRAKMRAGAGV